MEGAPIGIGARRRWRPPGSPSPAASRRARSSPPRASGPSCSTSVAAFVLKTRLRSRPLKPPGAPRGPGAALGAFPRTPGGPPPNLGCRGSPAAKTHVRYQEASPESGESRERAPDELARPTHCYMNPRAPNEGRAPPPDPLFQTPRTANSPSFPSQEDLYRPRPDYLEAVQRDGMSPQWRPKIMAWFDQLGDSFQLKAETLAMATNYLDRYLSRRSCGNVSFQLASIASIFLASKIEETRPFRTSDFVTLSDGLFTASDLRLMELELLCTLKWHLNPPTVHAAAHLLAGLLEDIPAAAGPCVDHEEVADRACAYADKVRADAAFLEYPPSMVAVATVICALKATDAPIDVVQAWMARVEQVRLPYADAPDASARVMKCGLRILELNGLGDELRDVDACAADAEVEAAMQSEFTEASDASSSLDDLSDRNSPSSVMEIDSANWQGPDLRAGAHFFPDGKTRAY